jgi:bifunctional DNA-binding transcriptional regulator/antitoxin component of YhaV-PrlF toxin-antitoxin module
MEHSIKLTSKRQATFPELLCRELGIHPGDRIILERKLIDEEAVWVIQPRSRSSHSWFGRLSRYAENNDHDMDTIRNSIGRGLGSQK